MAGPDGDVEMALRASVNRAHPHAHILFSNLHPSMIHHGGMQRFHASNAENMTAEMDMRQHDVGMGLDSPPSSSSSPTSPSPSPSSSSSSVVGRTSIQANKLLVDMFESFADDFTRNHPFNATQLFIRALLRDFSSVCMMMLVGMLWASWALLDRTHMVVEAAIVSGNWLINAALSTYIHYLRDTFGKAQSTFPSIINYGDITQPILERRRIIAKH